MNELKLFFQYAYRKKFLGGPKKGFNLYTHENKYKIGTK
jgi:hypothetical protein